MRLTEKQKKEKNRQRALKAWKTIRKNGGKKKVKKKIDYRNKKKENQREILINLIKKEILENDKFKENNPLREKGRMVQGIYLESPELLFTRKLQENNLLHEMFFKIPNHLEHDKFNHSRRSNIWGETEIQYEEHISGDFYHAIQNVCLDNCSYNDLVKGYEQKWNTAFIWADYCGAFSSFYEDIELTFSKKILGNGSIYALTFSIRDMAKSKKLPSISNINCMVALNDYVGKMAKKYGYIVELLPESGNYKQSMYTGIFKVIHPQLSKDTEKIIELQKTHDRLVSELNYNVEKIKKEYI